MTLQRLTNRSPWTVWANGTEILSGTSAYVDDDQGADLRCNDGVVMARVVEWPDETTEVVINAIDA
jgi:hypothetical protein